MINYFSDYKHLYRYDTPNISSRIIEGNIKITTLKACRNAEKEYFRDRDEGTRIITSLPGTNSLNSFDLAKLLGVDPTAICVRGENAVVTQGENAIHRQEILENAFIFCTSALENNAPMKVKFGDGCVKINDPIAFFTLIDKELQKKVTPIKLQRCVIDDVVYAPRINNYRDHPDKHIAFLKPCGEPSNFEKECEVRAIWIPDDFNIEPEFLAIPTVTMYLERLY